MPNKTEEYLVLAQRTANGLTRYWESWTDYLTTASQLYKYPFADQLMIYAQRPDATACADYRSRKSAVPRNCENVQRWQPNAIIPWAILSRQQKQG